MSLNVYIKVVQRYFKEVQSYSKLSDSRTQQKSKIPIKRQKKKDVNCREKTPIADISDN